MLVGRQLRLERDKRLLGQFGAALDGRPLPKLTGARLQALLTYLVLHAGAPQSRSQLAALFLPEVAESNDLRPGCVSG